MRTCLHCVVARVLRAEAANLAALGATVRTGPAVPVSVPQPAAKLFRALRALVRDAAAGGGPVKLTVLDLTGRSHVEVTAVARAGRGTRVLVVPVARHAEDTLAGGFAEGLGVS